MKSAQRPFRTNFYLWNGAAALFFSSCLTDPHSHNTMQLFVDLQGGFKCRLAGGNWETHRLLILRENVIHQLDTNGSVQLLIYLDAGSVIAQRIRTLYLEGGKDAVSLNIPLLAMLDPNELHRAMIQSDPQGVFTLVSRIFRLLTSAPEPVLRSDERISKVKELITSGAPAAQSIRTLAAAVYLSESRLRALFRRDTAVSLHKYLIWNRLRYGINLLMNGKSISDAAFDAGFSDSSHFHKMLIRMFGLGPGAFLKNNRGMQMVSCDESPICFETNLYDAQQQIIKVYR